jgi:hypothetical protein
MSQHSANTYNKVRVEPEVEAKIIGVLRKSGQPFRAVSRTDYYISKKQCDTLSQLNIPYIKL